jgi:hypothetical protein
MFATIAHIPGFHKIRSSAPKYQSANPLATPNIIRNKTQQLGRCISQRQYTAQFSSATSNCLLQNRPNLITPFVTGKPALSLVV